MERGNQVSMALALPYEERVSLKSVWVRRAPLDAERIQAERNADIEKRTFRFRDGTVFFDAKVREWGHVAYDEETESLYIERFNLLATKPGAVLVIRLNKQIGNLFIRDNHFTIISGDAIIVHALVEEGQMPVRF